MELPPPILVMRVSDGEYTVEARIGSSSPCYKQPVHLVIDTGSADFWVRSGKMPWIGSRGKWSDHRINQLDRPTFNVTYGDDFFASSYVVEAEVRLGNINGMQALQVPRQVLGITDVYGGHIENTPKFSQGGLLGLSLEGLRELPLDAGASLMRHSFNLDDDYELANALRAFTIKVPSGIDGRKTIRGEGLMWLFTGPNQLAPLRSKYKSPLWYSDVVPDPNKPADRKFGFWAFSSTMFYIGDEILQVDGNVGVADTGTSQALVRPEVCRHLYDKIDARYRKEEKGKWYLKRDTPMDAIPAFGIAVGKCPIWIAPQDIFDSAAAKTSNEEWLEGTFQSRGTDDKDLLGAPFLKNCVAVHAMGTPPQFGVMQVPHPDGKTFGDFEVSRKFAESNDHSMYQ